MPLFDDRGRLFGRLNLIDAAVGLFVFALVPLAYASWALFRLPPPQVVDVAPAVLAPGQPGQRIEVRGKNLRPYLNVDVGPGRAVYLFESAERAQIVVPPLPAGSYDLAFFDSKEIARFPSVVTVRPGTPVHLVVRFVTRPEILEAIKRSDGAPSSSAAAAPSARPELVSYQVIDELTGTTKSDLQQGRVSVVKGVVRLWANWTSDGWQSDGKPLRAGTDFTLTAPTYVLQGQILAIEPVSARP